MEPRLKVSLYAVTVISK